MCKAIIQNDIKTLKKLADDPNFTPNVYHRYGWTPLVSFVVTPKKGNFLLI